MPNLYSRYGKRILDVIGSFLGLLFLLPVFLIVGCCIKFSSPGTVFFRQTRIGMNGRPFRIAKFRSMVMIQDPQAPGLTRLGDRRITSVGRILRKYKIDELPQLWNVLRGNMSLVGPRPELPIYTACYTPHQSRVLSVRPGITDPASLFYRNEELLLQKCPDPERFYRETVLPHKLALNLDYIENVSLASDVMLIISTTKSMFMPFISETSL
jgi:lipopolysaccharide/colanic/teichoic acid biosynthesis glycosyltransferase